MATRHGKGGRRGHWYQLHVTVISPCALIDAKELHRQTTLLKIKAVLFRYAQLPAVLICDVDIGANIDDLEMVIPSSMQIRYLLDDRAGDDRFSKLPAGRDTGSAGKAPEYDLQ